VELNPRLALAHANLGACWQAKGQPDEAINACNQALALDPNCAIAHSNLGTALLEKGRLDEAIKECRKALALNPRLAAAHASLSGALVNKRLWDDALEECRQALALDPRLAVAHSNRGVALLGKGRTDEAVKALRQAIALDPCLALAHNNLGLALLAKGRFAEALAACRRFQKLAAQHPRWKTQAAARVSEVEKLIELEARLPAVLRGESKPATADLLALAACCRYKRLNTASARFYHEAFAAQPKLADDPRTGHRYNAACVAALAGCGQGEDAAKPDDKERARWRRQAREWLHTELKAWSKQLREAAPEDRIRLRHTLQNWQHDPDLAGVADEKALAKLPAPERGEWGQLWAKMATLLKRSEGKE
jgi:tetratricopeptide (TPR) repeat protein